MFLTCSELAIFMYRTRNSMNNLLSYCRLVDARISASIKDLTVLTPYKDFYVPYARHYKPRLVYFLPLFSLRLYCRVIYKAELLIFHDSFLDAKVAAKNRKDYPTFLLYIQSY